MGTVPAYDPWVQSPRTTREYSPCVQPMGTVPAYNPWYSLCATCGCSPCVQPVVQSVYNLWVQSLRTTRGYSPCVQPVGTVPTCNPWVQSLHATRGYSLHVQPVGRTPYPLATGPWTVQPIGPQPLAGTARYLGAKNRSGTKQWSSILILALSSLWMLVCRFMWCTISPAVSSKMDLS